MIIVEAPKNPVTHSVQLSGSKSISNRVLILTTLLGTKTTFKNLSNAEDTLLLQDALDTIKRGGQAIINVNHAGTNARFLTALLSVTPGDWILTGSARLKERPMRILVNALRLLGADIQYMEKPGFLPLKIKGGKIKGGKVIVDASVSSQFVSALLLISPILEHGLEITIEGKPVSGPYISMTICLLEQFGIKVRAQDNKIIVLEQKPQTFPEHFTVEADWSSASYWYSICALSQGSKIFIELTEQNSLQADSVLPTLFTRLGVKSEFKANGLSLSYTGNPCSTFVYDFTDCPDIAPTLAACCAGLGVVAKLNGLTTLRIKESDRITALAIELKKFGMHIISGSDFLEIEPLPYFHKTENIHISTYNDHRMAMSFAPLALVCNKLCVNNESVVTKSYPHFWRDLQTAGFSVNLQP